MVPVPPDESDEHRGESATASRILVVEDDRSRAKTVAELLASEGFRVVVAESFERLVSVVRIEVVSLSVVSLDFGGGGEAPLGVHEFLRRALRSAVAPKATHAPRAIALAREAERESKERQLRALEAGFFSVLFEPLARDEFRSCLHRALSGGDDQ
jgi:CheY-like chemotaxis protein